MLRSQPSSQKKMCALDYNGRPSLPTNLCPTHLVVPANKSGYTMPKVVNVSPQTRLSNNTAIIANVHFTYSFKTMGGNQAFPIPHDPLTKQHLDYRSDGTAHACLQAATGQQTIHDKKAETPGMSHSNVKKCTTGLSSRLGFT